MIAIQEQIDELIKYGRSSNKLVYKALDKLEDILNGEVTHKQMEIILQKNRFEGLFIVDSAIFEDNFGEKIEGVYLDKYVFISEKYRDKYDVVCHEMVHALIGNKIKPLGGLEETTSIAKGLEEGIASVVSRGIDKKDTSHQYDRILVKQLNKLYKYCDNKKYSNLVVHAILEPKTIVPLVRDIYLDILKKIMGNTKETHDLAYKSAYNFLVISDELKENKDHNMLILMSKINFLYYALSDRNVLYGEKLEKNKTMFLIDKYESYITYLKLSNFTSIDYASEVIFKSINETCNYISNYIYQLDEIIIKDL